MSSTSNHPRFWRLGGILPVAATTTTQNRKEETKLTLIKATGELMVYQALDDIDTAIALVEEELVGEDINPASALPRIKIPAGGGTDWTVPDLYGNKLVQELVGIPIFETRARTYWAKSFEESGGGNLPDCSSNDGKRGVGPLLGRDPSNGIPIQLGEITEETPMEWDCKPCPFAQWGTGPNGGKACKQVRLLALLTPDELLPYILIASPGSIAAVNAFIARIKAHKIKPHHAIIGLSLVTKKNKQGLTYSAIEPRLIAQVREEDREACDLLAETWKPILKNLGIERDQVESSDMGNFGYGHHTTTDNLDIDPDNVERFDENDLRF